MGSESNDLTTIPPFVREAIHDRVVGSLVGSALGDAIGLYTEFLSEKDSAKAYPTGRFTLAKGCATKFHDDSHRDPHREGEWTDDTDQALLILLSFLHRSGTSSAAAREPALDTWDFARRLKIWVHCGLRALDTLPLGLGNLVASVVRSREYAAEIEEGAAAAGTEPGAKARAVWERGRCRNAPNGSLMRTHPLGAICLRRSEDATFSAAAAFSRVTHMDPRCIFACAAGTALVRGLLRGDVLCEAGIDALLARATDWYLAERKRRGENDTDPELDLDELQRHVGASVTLADLCLDENGKIGYVYKTLGSGVVALRLAMRRVADAQGALLVGAAVFEDLISDITMRGGDADTNACFAGALLGAYLGYGALPGHWKHGLLHEAWLMDKCESLCRVLDVADGEYDGQKDTDTRPDGGRGLLDEKAMEDRWNGLMKRILEGKEATKKAEAKPEKRLKLW